MTPVEVMLFYLGFCLVNTEGLLLPQK